MKAQTQTLAEQWRDLLEQEPKLRIRDAAAKLGVSEAELLATRCETGSVRRLEGDWRELVKRLPELGEVMCLTRNEHAVHERYGKFEQVQFFGMMGQVVGPDIDLRLFMSRWHHGFAVADETSDGPRRSLQFFDQDGSAVHKVYAQEGEASFENLAKDFLSANQEGSQLVLPVEPAAPEKPDSEIDADAFRAEWLALQDTHEFFGMLRKFGVSRMQALRLAPEGHVSKVDASKSREMLEGASTSGQSIMVFIGSPGCLQIHTGPVENIRMFGTEWLNVLDERFNMHLRMTGVDSAWIVRKPTRDGVVTSLELFNSEGEQVVMFFGKRKPGQAEDEAWRRLLEATF